MCVFSPQPVFLLLFQPSGCVLQEEHMVVCCHVNAQKFDLAVENIDNFRSNTFGLLLLERKCFTTYVIGESLNLKVIVTLGKFLS